MSLLRPGVIKQHKPNQTLTRLSGGEQSDDGKEVKLMYNGHHKEKNTD